MGYIEESGGDCVPDPAAADWSFLVFLNADNNLESYGYDDVSEMGAAGSTTSVHIAALFDTYSQDNGDARKIAVTQGGYVVEENLGMKLRAYISTHDEVQAVLDRYKEWKRRGQEGEKRKPKRKPVEAAADWSRLMDREEDAKVLKELEKSFEETEFQKAEDEDEVEDDEESE